MNGVKKDEESIVLFLFESVSMTKVFAYFSPPLDFLPLGPPGEGETVLTIERYFSSG